MTVEPSDDSPAKSVGIEALLTKFDPEAYTSPAMDVRRAMAKAEDTKSYFSDLAELSHLHSEKLTDSWSSLISRQLDRVTALMPGLATATPKELADYLVDFIQRQALFVDTLRRRGNQFVHQEEEGNLPALAYEYDVIIDGETLDRPVNYSLVRIRAPEDVKTRENGRPYIIIDPRAGHGSGIGGFKHESEVGCALAAGHPTYFVIFRTHPTKTQTLADVCRAEAKFVREVRRRHPFSPKPIVVGNCQGGWAAMLVAATNPDLTGPVVVNGAPLSYWAGLRGKSPLRYMSALTGGILPALMVADMGNGEFDGANLVFNFEALSPSNTWWQKYYDLFAKGDKEAERYLQFERWWSGFYFMNENEIHWIIENLFIGNKLARGGAKLDARTHIDLHNIRAPIIVFASHGDNITPVPQALSWIADTYDSVQEIKARGQRIIYTVHDSIGHLGIFVASSVANKQHKEIVSTLKTIEAMAPGLYEMKILEVAGEGQERTYEVAFEERSIDDVLAFSDPKPGDRPFKAMARLSEMNAQIYNMTMRPWLRAMVSPSSAKMMRDAHPLRSQRYAISDINPAVAPVEPIAKAVREGRREVDPNNSFLALEHTIASAISDCWDLFRDVRDSLLESWTLGIFCSPLLQPLADSDELDMQPPPADLRSVPDVRNALERIEQGGFVVAVIRMLVQLAHSRGGVRRDRLERSNHVLTATEPFASLGEYKRSAIIQQQSIIVDFEPEEAMATLPKLLMHMDDRRRALEICEGIAGAREEMDPSTIAMFEQMRKVLGVDGENVEKIENAADATEAAPKPAAPATKSSSRKRQTV